MLRESLATTLGVIPPLAHLLQRFVVHEACGIFREIELPALDLLAELPALCISIGQAEDVDRMAYMVVSRRELRLSRALESEEGRSQGYSDGAEGVELVYRVSRWSSRLRCHQCDVA